MIIFELTGSLGIWRAVCREWFALAVKSKQSKRIRLSAVVCSIKTLQWARENGCDWDVWTCAHAAKGGHLEVLQWARANGCPWDECTCAAAGGGHLEVLKWARENGCPWDERTCTHASINGHLDVLQWAEKNGCPNKSY